MRGRCRGLDAGAGVRHAEEDVGVAVARCSRVSVARPALGSAYSPFCSRLSSTCPIWPVSPMTGGRSAIGPDLELGLGRLLQLGPEEERRVVHAAVQLEGPAVALLAAAAELEQALHDALAAQRALLDELRATRGPPSLRPASRFISCAKARMPPSGLLISCATPPASWPTAAIFSVSTSRRGHGPLVGDVAVRAHRLPLLRHGVDVEHVGSSPVLDLRRAPSRSLEMAVFIGQPVQGGVPAEEELVAGGLWLTPWTGRPATRA